MKRILVALDGSDRGPMVLAAAARLAEQSGARLVLFRAIGLPIDVPREVFTVPQVQLEDVLRRAAHADLDRLCRFAVTPEEALTALSTSPAPLTADAPSRLL